MYSLVHFSSTSRSSSSISSSSSICLSNNYIISRITFNLIYLNLLAFTITSDFWW